MKPALRASPQLHMLGYGRDLIFARRCARQHLTISDTFALGSRKDLVHRIGAPGEDTSAGNATYLAGTVVRPGGVQLILNGSGSFGGT